MTEEAIVNKVAHSGLVTIDLADYAPEQALTAFDIAPWLFRGMILKEQEFRDHVKQHNWAQYQNQIVCVHCSADAIVPTWAYMLLAVALKPFATRTFLGTVKECRASVFNERLSSVDYSAFQDVRVIIKGCGDIEVPVNTYVQVTSNLLPYAKSIMYGEACSNVPVFKKK